MSNGKSSKKIKTTTVCLMTWLAMGYIASAQAAVVVDITQAEKPWVKANSNGSVTVNINSASPSGISHNKFTQFDVTKQGVVLNNNTVNSTTQLAGQVAGNSKLSGGKASLIINEVTSRNPSLLNGQIEVAGQKADVIVANPSGVTCSGCGFINTGRGTLTTGTPNVSNGKLTGINVQKGRIVITGLGMKDASDYTTLLANVINVNGKINANEIQVMTGVNSNIVTSGKNLVNIGYTGNTTSELGLDVAALGGMYANKITLIATNNADMFNNKGIISSNTDLEISSQGYIMNNSGTLESKKGKMSLNGNSIGNSNGKIFSGDSIDIVTGDSLYNKKGRIDSQKLVAVNATRVDNEGGYITGDEVSIVSGSLVNTNSKIYSDNPKSQLEGGIHAAKDVSINTNGLLNNSAGWVNTDTGSISLVSNSDLVLNYARINAKKDILVSSNTLDFPATSKPDPIDAHLKAGNDINFNVGNLGKFDSTTVLNADHDINFNSLDGLNTGTFLNYATLIASNNITYNHGDVVNYGKIIAGNEINIKTEKLLNHNTISGYGDVKISATNSIFNDYNGDIISFKKLTLNGPTINNYRGKLTGQKGIDIYARSFSNSGSAFGELNKYDFKPNM